MEDLTTETLPSAEQDVPALDGGVAANPASEEAVELHQVLNEALGKQFPNPEAALKSLKDTYNAVGKYAKFKPLIEQLEQKKGGELNVIKLMEQLTKDEAAPVAQPEAKVEAPKVDPNVVTKDEFEEYQWFSNHKELEPQKTVIKALKAQTGKTFDEIIQMEELKPLIHSQNTDASKSVIHSNTVLADTSSDYESDFKKAQETGNWGEFLTKHKGLDIKG
jgi:uncharacterized protein YjcR